MNAPDNSKTADLAAPQSYMPSANGVRPSLATAIAEHPFFKGMRPAHLDLLVDSAMTSHFAAGELIFREGDPANRFYVIQKGTVALESNLQDRGAILIQTVGAGDVLGWSWLFPPYYWHFDARAIEPTQAIFFYGTRLRERCEEDHALGYALTRRMVQVVLQRLQATRQQLVAAWSAHGKSPGSNRT